MTGQDRKPAFYCPQCGQKHRADISALLGVEGAVLQATCAGCGIALAVTLDEDDLPICRALEDFAGVDPAAPSGDAKKPDTPLKKSRSAEKSPPAPQKRRGGQAPVSARRHGTRSASPADKGAEAPSGATDDAEGSIGKGEHIGRYQIESPIGHGGTSEVYAAFDPTTNRTVALKVLKPDQSDGMRQRFLREIEVQANIRHQNIMPIFDRGELDDGRPFFTMERLYSPWTLTKLVEHRERGTLGRYTTLKDLSEIEVLIEKIVVPVCDGIYVANVENGVVHRDLKPDNVLIDSRTLRPYVIDFGICQSVETKSRLDTGPVIATDVEEAGIVGTPRFLSPEQSKGHANARTDVWGLGALLQFVLTGEPPIAGAVPITRAELKRRIRGLEEAKQVAIREGSDKRIALCDEKLARLQDPGLRTLEAIFKDSREGVYGALPAHTPAPLAAVVHKAMSVQQGDRYVNARQLSAELAVWLKGGAVRALSQTGGAAAAVQTAKQAVSRHLVTAVWIVAALGAGLLLGSALAGKQSAGSSSRIADATQDVEALEKAIVGLQSEAPSLTAVERHRMWHFLDARGGRIETRIADEPASTALDAVRRRLHYVRGRMAPLPVVLDVGDGLALHATDLVTGDAIGLHTGENRLAPGAYGISLGDDSTIRFPLNVPLHIRGVNEKPAQDPALAVVRLPLRPEAIPPGMVLVLGGEVTPRGLPYAEATSQIAVGAFLIDRTEVTNAAYGEYLLTLPAAERTARMPSVGFVPDAAGAAPTPIEGKETLPVVGVRPEDAAAYAAWRGKREGAAVRLVREDEWVLAAGAGLGYVLADGASGVRTDGDFDAPLKPAGRHPKDVSPYGVRGLLGNAREIVTSAYDDAYLVKGAGVGDDPDQGAIYALRKIPKDARQPVTGFRCVRLIPAAAGEPPR